MKLPDFFRRKVAEKPNALRVLFIANADIPTLQICFTRPLEQLIREGDAVSLLLTEQKIKDLRQNGSSSAEAGRWLIGEAGKFHPDLIVFCRYSGPYAAEVLDWAASHEVPVIYHLDDDLLAIPPELGEKKYAFHNAPERLASVRTLMDGASLIYASTPKLKQRLEGYRVKAPVIAGDIYCPSNFTQPPQPKAGEVRIGYMGFDHAHDFELALPALIATLDAYPQATFELFGSIPKPAALDRFGKRVSVLPPVQGYDAFMQKFASRHWDIGICPLADTPFNSVKANTKWVEYSSVGAAVIASGNTLYDACCADGSGMLATNDAEWQAAFAQLIQDQPMRLSMVKQAQARLAADYTMERLRAQVLAIFARVLPLDKRQVA